MSGVDLARQALLAAREAAKKNGAARQKPKRRTTTVVRRDGREPLGLGSAIGMMMTERGMAAPAAGGSILTDFDTILEAVVPPRAQRDHPRVRGEQDDVVEEGAEEAGPSPRARGAEAEPHPVDVGVGTIPAGAGSSTPSGLSFCVEGDHPRGRGEQKATCSMLIGVAGPSPRARGAEVGARGLDVLVGTIPAGAGSRTRAA